MKKFILSFIASFLFLSLSTSAADFGFGIKGHLGASMITNAQSLYKRRVDDKAGLFNSAKIGGGGGIYGEYSFTESIGVRLEGLFNFAGTSYSSEKKKQSYTTGSLRLPILAKIYPMGPDTGFSILAGLELGFPLTKKAVISEKKSDRWEQSDEDKDFDKDGFNSFAIGANVGVEYELTEIGVNFGLNYIFDITKMFKNKDIAAEKPTGVGKDDNVHFQNIRLSVGYNFANVL